MGHFSGLLSLPHSFWSPKAMFHLGIEAMADSVRKTSRVEAFFINIYNAMLERSELFCEAMEGVAAAS
jgi:hypothetical protein